MGEVEVETREGGSEGRNAENKTKRTPYEIKLIFSNRYHPSIPIT
jgi:hypothetical protein